MFDKSPGTLAIVLSLKDQKNSPDYPLSSPTYQFIDNIPSITINSTIKTTTQGKASCYWWKYDAERKENCYV